MLVICIMSKLLRPPIPKARTPLSSEPILTQIWRSYLDGTTFKWARSIAPALLRCLAASQFLSSAFLSLRDRSGLTVFAFIWNVPPASLNPARVSIRQGEIRALQKGPDEPVPVGWPLAAHVKLNVRIVSQSHKFYDLSRALLPWTCSSWLEIRECHFHG